MASVAFTIGRLLGALEELGRAEEIALASGDGVGFLALQHQAEPLVTRIAALVAAPDGPDELDENLRARGQALIRDQKNRGARLHALMNQLRGEIGRIDQARIQARNLRPAYGRRRLSAGLKPAFAGQG